MPREPSPPPRSTMRFCSDEQHRQPICNRGTDGLRRLPASCGVARLRAAETGASGGYLEEISKTDIATLDAGEWREFLRRLFVGYELALRRKILNNEPPF